MKILQTFCFDELTIHLKRVPTTGQASMTTVEITEDTDIYVYGNNYETDETYPITDESTDRDYAKLRLAIADYILKEAGK